AVLHEAGGEAPGPGRRVPLAPHEQHGRIAHEDHARRRRGVAVEDQTALGAGRARMSAIVLLDETAAAVGAETGTREPGHGSAHSTGRAGCEARRRGRGVSRSRPAPETEKPNRRRSVGLSGRRRVEGAPRCTSPSKTSPLLAPYRCGRLGSAPPHRGGGLSSVVLDLVQSLPEVLQLLAKLLHLVAKLAIAPAVRARAEDAHAIAAIQPHTIAVEPPRARGSVETHVRRARRSAA